MPPRTKRPKYPTIPLQKVVLVRDKSVEVPEHISCAWQASAIAKQLTDGSPDESLIVFCVNGDHQLIGAQIVATGAPDSVAFSPSQVFRAAIVSNAAGIIVAHNHPSGSRKLSADDVQTAKLIEAAGKLLGIALLDFIVVVHNKPGCASIHD